MLNRRSFIRRSSLAGAFLLTPSWMRSLQAGGIKTLVILHTNDIHSHIDPFPANDPKFPNQGGLARIATLVKEIREAEQHVILLDSGDIFQGTPYFNRFGGKAEYELMSSMGYVASTPGNHDFDNGVNGLSSMLPYANFQMLNANYRFENTVLAGKIKPSAVVDVNGIKVGLLGVGIELEGLVPPQLCKDVLYTDPVAAANREAEILKKEHQCDVVICLSHLGYRYDDKKIDDRKFAGVSRNIDVILGGHTHTFMPAPELIANADGKEVVINQAGWGGLRLGRINMGIR
jgi:5'-nucleotidase